MFIFIVVIIAVTYLFILYKQKFDYSKYEKTIPGPKGVPILGNALEIASLGTREFFQKLLFYEKQYGGRYRLQLAHEYFVFISNPKDIETIMTSPKLLEKSNDYIFFGKWLGDGLLISHDQKWHARRKILTNAFHFKILDDFIGTFDIQADVLVKQLGKHLDNQPFDICPYITLYTLDVICETTMGIKMNVQVDSNCEYVKNVVEISKIIYSRMYNAFARVPFIWSLMPISKRHDYLLKRIQEFVTKVIETKRAEVEKKIEINQNIIEEEDEFPVKKRYALLDLLLNVSDNGEPLTDIDIRDEVNNFMFAGHDTTTSAIEFLMFNLAKYPDVQKKVFEEIVEVFGNDPDEPITMKKLNDLQYLDIVIKESLRLYAPVPMIGRQSKEGIEINGVQYPPGCSFFSLIYAMHRNPKYFDNPDAFLPERHLTVKSADSKSLFSYIPFAAGFRNCIGQKFALYEIKSAISKMLRCYQFELGQEGFEPIMVPELILKPTNGIVLKIKSRIY